MRISILFSLTSLFFCCLIGAQELPSTEIHFAFFSNGIISLDDIEDFQTVITITNPGEADAEVSVTFFSRQGNELEISINGADLLAGERVLVPGHASVEVTTVPGLELITGWLKISSTRAVTARANIRRIRVPPLAAPVGVLTVVTAASISPSIPLREFFLFLVETSSGVVKNGTLSDGWGSGVSLVNPSSTGEAKGTLELFNSQGVSVASKEIVLGPNMQLLQLGQELFPELTELTQGTVKASFDSEVIATSIRFNKVNNALTTNLISRRSAP